MEKQTRTTYALAEITRNISFAHIPETVVRKAKALILDSIACMLGGVHTVQGQKIRRLFTSMQGIPQAQVIGTKARLPLLNSAYVNSYLATVLDFDDTYDGHPGSTVVPVAINLGDNKDISGRSLIEAVTAGYEVGIRVSNGIKPSPERTKKVRGINTWQIFCAAAATAKVLGLGIEEIAHTYGHAAIHATVPSLRKWGFSDGRIQWLKNNFGWTSYGGILSGLLAQEGFIADTTIFDGADGFWIMASSDQCDYDALREPLSEWYTLQVHTKPYSACRHIHPTLDAISAIVAQARPNPVEIEKIEVETFYEVVNDYSFLPKLPFDVVFSAPYLCALILHGIPPGPAWFDSVYLEDPRVIRTAKQVTISEWDEASRLYPLVNRELMSRVRITDKGGQTLDKTIRIPKGDPRNPMSDTELFSKLSMLAEPVIGTQKTELLYQRVMEDLEGIEKISEIIALLFP